MPVPITDTALQEMLSSNLPLETRFLMSQLFASRSFQNLWTRPEVLQKLRSECMLCGQAYPTALLCKHLSEAHCSGHSFVDFYLETLIPVIEQCFHTDYQCPLCCQYFNMMPEVITGETSEDRATLVRAHLLANCPNLLQTAILLSTALNGRRLLQLQPNPRRQKNLKINDPGSVAAAAPPNQAQPLLQMLKMTAQLVLRHEHNWNLLQSTDSFVLFFQQEPQGVLQGMAKETQHWQEQRSWPRSQRPDF
eukprot:s3708_g3.t1